MFNPTKFILGILICFTLPAVAEAIEVENISANITSTTIQETGGILVNVSVMGSVPKDMFGDAASGSVTGRVFLEMNGDEFRSTGFHDTIDNEFGTSFSDEVQFMVGEDIDTGSLTTSAEAEFSPMFSGESVCSVFPNSAFCQTPQILFDVISEPEPSSVPEPSSAFLVAAGSLALVGLRCRRRKHQPG